MNTAPINLTAMMGTTTANSSTAQAVGNGDFAAMLMQMLGGQGTGDPLGLTMGEEEAMLYAQQLLAGEDELADSQDGTDNAMQMMAAMFMSTPADVNFVQSPMAYRGGVGVTGSLGTTANTAQALAVNGEAATPEQLAAFVQTATPEQLNHMFGTVRPGTKATQNATNDTKTIADSLLAGATQTKDSATAMAIAPLQSAYNRLYGINKPAETATKGEQTLDIEALQQAVDNGTYLNRSVVDMNNTVKGSEQVTPRDIANQVQAGILSNLDSEQKEFTIKLRPEGLGDITVKLIENAGKISLSITTSTQQAQNALSQELGSLREALRPYNAEITQLVANEMSFAQHQQSMGEHRHDAYQGGQQRGEQLWATEEDTPEENIRAYTEYINTSSALHERI